MITRNVAFRHGEPRGVRKRTYVGDPAPVLSKCIDNAPPPSRVIEARETAERIHWLIQRLSPLDRQAVELHYLQGLKVTEMEQELPGTPEGTIKRRLNTARGRLGKAILDHERGLVPHGYPVDAA
jgi:RNA polymerase sigma factor (sigma-70 family)